MNIIVTWDKEKWYERLNENEKNDESIRIYDNTNTMMDDLNSNDEVGEIVVIGGASITKIMLDNFTDSLKYIIYTRVIGRFNADVFVDPIDESIFKPIFISKTFWDNDVIYDIVYYGNVKFLENNFTMYPKRIINWLPK